LSTVHELAKPKYDVSSEYFELSMIEALESHPSLQNAGPLVRLAWMFSFHRYPVVSYLDAGHAFTCDNCDDDDDDGI